MSKSDIYCVDCGYHSSWEEEASESFTRHRFVPLSTANANGIDIPDYDMDRDCGSYTPEAEYECSNCRGHITRGPDGRERGHHPAC